MRGKLIAVLAFVMCYPVFIIGTRGCVSGYYGSRCNMTCPEGCRWRHCDSISGNCFHGCVNGVYGSKCDTPCAPGCLGQLKTCDSDTGHCTQGCVDGVYGGKCDMSCPSGCLGQPKTCDRNTGHCTQGCMDGVYGGKCDTPCSSGCLGQSKTCDRYSGHCTQGCEIGKYGNTCERPCSADCKSGCHRENGQCSACFYKKYGDYCNRTCWDGCDNKTCTNKYWSCYCKPEYQGIRCTDCADGRYGTYCKEWCPQHCDGVCDKKSGDCPACVSGYYGDRCRQHCGEGCKICDKSHGVCQECKTGRFGDTCRDHCSRFCKNYRSCHKITGKCIYGCMGDRYGVKCQYRCSVNCFYGSCNWKTGTCDYGCKTGTYGRLCDRNCPENCEGDCNLVSGSCKACRSGYYGNRCEKKCGEGCKNRSCHKNNGYCVCKDGYNDLLCRECRDGRYGEKNCINECPETCSGPCNKTTGSCPACKERYHGNHCDKLCGEGCLGNGACDQSTGECKCEGGYKSGKCEECDDGRYGIRCKYNCSATCSGPCDKWTGHCPECLHGYYGNQCDKDCGEGCLGDGSCKQTTGECRCKVGYNKGKCEVCEEGLYGPRCKQTCAVTCVNGCDKTSGLCVSCLPGHYGDRCESTCWPGCDNTTCTKNYTQCECREEYQGDRCEAYVRGKPIVKHAAIVVPLLICIFCVIGILLIVTWFRKGKPQFWKRSFRERNGNLELHTLYGLDQQQRTDTSLTENFPVKVSDYPLYMKQLLRKEDGFDDDFKRISIDPVSPWNVGTQPKNLNKNRFRNIIPYDKNRVMLNNGENGDYINASYINGYERPRAFIAAQGPSPLTLTDFTMMLWEQRVPLVVMVTNLEEAGKVKCAQYWADPGETKRIGSIIVTSTSVVQKPHYIIRHLVFTQGGDEHQVTQLHFVSWPDHGVPTNPASFLSFYRHAVQLYNPRVGPTLVHCSAGVGRTGTFLAMDYLLNQARREGAVSVSGCIQNLRQQRVSMVQNAGQYIFIHECLLEALLFESTVYDVEAYDPVSAVSSSDIRRQFQVLDILMTPETQGTSHEGIEHENKSKNRKYAPVPNIKWRPVLVTPVTGRNAYINAVYVEGYTKNDCVYVTQSPTADTIVDLWRLVYDYKCPIIVALNRTGTADFPDYLPQREDTFGCLKIKTVKVTDEEMYTKTKLQLNVKRQSLVLHQVSLRKTLQETLPDVTTMLTLVEEVQKLKRESPEGAMVVHCQYGVGLSGLFCALMIICCKINHEQEVDVFHAVKQIRKSRPQFISTMEQYKWLHQAAGQYISSMQTYANFRC